MTSPIVIGLEIHAQLKTRTKIFSPASALYCAEPNAQVREVDGGLPGALPSLNRAAVECAVQFGVAVGGRVNPRSEFARKNYFYPDLPKGYQISQYEYPVVSGGAIVVEDSKGGEKSVGLIRAHLEEDAGKLAHEGGASVADLNRAGVPLLEIVSEPHIFSAAEAAAYAKTVHALVRWLDICDGNMQEGSFRMDANISLRDKKGNPGVRCEIKNLNSFRFLEQALNYEAERQAEVLQSGGTVTQQTLLFDPARGETRPMRGKEDAEDYRYFPDPDLPPLLISEETIARIKESLPVLPRARRRMLAEKYGLNGYDAGLLCAARELADYFEKTLAELAPAKENLAAVAKTAANWILGDLASLMNRHSLSAKAAPVNAKALAGLLRAIGEGVISGKTAKAVLETMWKSGENAEAIIAREGLRQISDEGELQKLAEEIVRAHPAQAQEYRSGKEKLLAFFVGKIMSATKGKANPAQASAIIKKTLAD